MRMRAADAVVAVLEALGVQVAFGMCGHGNLPLLDALVGSRIRFISCHHEQVAVHAADAYYRVTGTPGVVLTTLGPGMTNTATGLGDAALDGSAVLVISGDVPSRFAGLQPYQEIAVHAAADQWEVTRPLTKRSYRVTDPAALSHLLHRAWHEAVSGSPGPVHVHVPLDIFSAEVDYLPAGLAAVERPALADGVAEQIIDRLAAAERPVLFVGGGSVDAAPELRAFAAATRTPVATSMIAQGVMPESDPLALGFTGVVGARPANVTVRTADLLLAIGTRFAEMDASSWRPEHFLDPRSCELIQIDIDASALGRVYVPAIAAVADAQQALRQLTAAAAHRQLPSRDEYAAELASLQADWAAELADVESDSGWPMQPPHLLRVLRSLLPADAVVVSGVGVRHMVGQHFPVEAIRTLLVPSGFSTMGWETGAVLGAAVAAAGRPVVGVLGDGAFNSTLSALPTAVAAGVKAVWLVLDNHGYQSISAYQDRHFGRRIGTDFELASHGETFHIDYVGIARAYGADAERVSAADQLSAALQRALAAPGNYLVEIPTAGKVKALASGQWDVNTIAAGDVGLLPAPLG